MIQSELLFIPSLIGAILYLVFSQKKSFSSTFYYYTFLFLVSNALTFLGIGSLVLSLQIRGIKSAVFFLNQYYLYLAVPTCLLLFFMTTIKKIRVEKELPNGGVFRRVLKVVGIFLLLFLGCLALLGSLWVTHTFGEVSPDQILFHLLVPMEGTNTDFVWSFVIEVILYSTLASIAMAFFVANPGNFKFVTSGQEHKDNSLMIIGLVDKFKLLLIIAYSFASIALGLKIIGVKGFYEAATRETPFIEEQYVDPQSVALNFPEEKRNLIFIFVESLETTFVSEALGGSMPENYIEPLTILAKDGVSFTQEEKPFVGADTTTGTGWTIAGMFAQTSGLPLKVDVQGNEYGQDGTPFAPGATSIGDVLKEVGYNQMIMVGSDLTFGGRRAYFTQHGEYEVFDYLTAKERELIPEDYNEWWGFEDSKLFEFAKQGISELAEKEAPFNFTMLTANTHHIDGYLEQEAEKKFDEQYSNVYAHSAEQVYEFVNWIMQQEFYENTSVVITGDHQSMDGAYFERLEIPGEQRKVFNLFLNSPAFPETKQRNFTTLDIFPTTLAALGVDIEGDRLGLGTNLFGTRQTLSEEFGIDKLNEELGVASPFYTSYILNE